MENQNAASVSIEYRGLHRFPGYAFGSDGTVWSCLRLTGRSSTLSKFGSEWKLLPGSINAYGYRYVGIGTVARLILEAFIGAKDSTFDPLFKDGCRLNCAVSNLEWTPRAGGPRGFQTGHPNFVTEHGRQRISETTRERWAAGLMPRHSEETRRKISEAGKGRKQTEDTKRKIGIHNRALIALGKHNLQALTPEQRALASKNKPPTLNLTEAERDRRRNFFSGSNNPKWAGGVTPLTMKIRLCNKYAQWRKAVFRRDNWTCQKCKRRGCPLEGHHLFPFCMLIRELFETFSGKPTFEDAMAFDKLWDISNGLTLCESCHDSEREYFGNQHENRLLQSDP